jgi:hypothetical protein
MSQDLADQPRLLDAGDHPQFAATMWAVLDIERIRGHPQTYAKELVDTHKPPKKSHFLQDHSLITYKYFEFPQKIAEICGCPGFF